MISNSKHVYGMLYFSKGLNPHWNKFPHLGSFETKETSHVPTRNGCYLHLCSTATVGLCPDHSSVNQPPASLDLLLKPLGTFSCSVGCLVWHKISYTLTCIIFFQGTCPTSMAGRSPTTCAWVTSACMPPTTLPWLFEIPLQQRNTILI